MPAVQRKSAAAAASASATAKNGKNSNNGNNDQSKLPGVLADPKAAAEWVPPPFTLKDVRDAVPAHCFKRNTFYSMLYVVHDLAIASALFYAALFIPSLPLIAQCVAWPLYWIAQGGVCTGIWVIAHECGHGAFSPHTWVNNTVGYILHTALLVPYYSWKFTHSRHHKSSSHMDKDQVFVPHVRSKTAQTAKPAKHDHDHDHDHPLTETAPIIVLLEIIRNTLFGWPAYLLVNASGQLYPGWNSHFKAKSAMFEEKNYDYVNFSTLGLFVVIGFLAYLGQVYGPLNVIFYYVIPYLVVNFWLVTITFLQHTDPAVPHFRGEEWDFLRGALSTVDRDYGIYNYFHHHIGDTHVVHHLFSTMPHYHAQEATAAVKKFLGKYY
eukprot:jgi/Hompol1/6212/HPOL_004904-RA